jgi:molecular chaperone GrpE
MSERREPNSEETGTSEVNVPEENQELSAEETVNLEGAEGDSAEVTALKSELAVMKDRALRAVAEAENVRRRSDKERQDTLKYASANLAKELLPVIDNLRRAVESVPEEAQDESDVLKNLLVGVEMTEKMLLDAFSKQSIEKIDPVDEKFNHGEHQAIQELPGTGKPAGTVVQVLQPGYKLHDRLLRPAMVITARGDPDAAPDNSTTGVDATA